MKQFMPYIFAMTVCLACNDPEINRLQDENKALKKAQAHRDSVMQELTEAYEVIDSNNSLIKAREKNIQHFIRQPEISAKAKDSVVHYIHEIDSLNLQNRTVVSQLDSSLKTSSIHVPGVRQMVGSLHDKNSFTETELGQLKGRLATISKDFRELFEEYAETEANRMRLEEDNSELIQSNTNLQESNSKLIARLNEAWYAMGSKSELKEKGLLNRKGVLVNRQLNNELNKDFFQQIDIRDFHTLSLNARKALLITPHPPASYRFTGSKRQVNKLIIKDMDEFWSVSRYLLIEVEK